MCKLQSAERREVTANTAIAEADQLKSASNIDVIRGGYAAFERGDMQTVFAILPALR